MVFIYLNYSGSSVYLDVNANSQDQTVKLKKKVKELSF